MNPCPPVLQGSHRATFSIVDLAAIAENLRQIRGLLPPGTAVCAVVKADAYGHGAVPVARELEKLGTESFAVATVEEGIQLRQAGIQRPILVLGMGPKGHVEALENRLTPIIHSPELAAQISDVVRKMKRPVSVHVKVDTGMGRLGLFPEQTSAVLDELRTNPWIRIDGMASHFSSAESDPEFTGLQMDRFRRALKELDIPVAGGFQVHIANSAGLLNCPGGSCSMVRPGIILYGVYPDSALKDKIRLTPAMTFKTHVLAVKEHPAASPISYGQTFRTGRPSRIATLPVGYADGYRRDLSNRGCVLVRGVRAPVAGTVTMDLTMVDVTDVPHVSAGDEVILFGRAEQGLLPVEEVAETIHTIGYELLCAVSRRVPRIYKKNGEIPDVERKCP